MLFYGVSVHRFFLSSLGLLAQLNVISKNDPAYLYVSLAARCQKSHCSILILSKACEVHNKCEPRELGSSITVSRGCELLTEKLIMIVAINTTKIYVSAVRT